MPRNRKALSSKVKPDNATQEIASKALIAPQGKQLSAGSRIKSLSMTIRLLTEMAHAGSAIGVTDIARRVGESKARIHRHLQTLRDAGILAQSDSDERYRLGWVLFELGQAAASQFEVADIAAPAMRRLRDATHLTVLLGQRDGDDYRLPNA
ncbi:MAG: helix-turn-helix domain-containing protein [Pseudomonadota bacterium]|nr:helix-turn-helix domain-containing protein [Pseudomonadota bacterium]